MMHKDEDKYFILSIKLYKYTRLNSFREKYNKKIFMLFIKYMFLFDFYIFCFCVQIKILY